MKLGGVGTWTLNRLLHEVASWALTVAAVVVVFAFSVDCGAVLASGHSLRIALASGLTGAALAAWVALIVAPILTFIAAASSFVEARAPRLFGSFSAGSRRSESCSASIAQRRAGGR